MSKKPSFFEKLSGSVGAHESLDAFDEETNHPRMALDKRVREEPTVRPAPLEEEDFGKGAKVSDGQLPVDVHQTPSEIVIRAFVAGVRPDDLNISISRDMVEIDGSRMEREQIATQDYFTRELFWGTFSRTIMLPQEVDVEASSANAKDGLLTIILPKLDKARQTKLKVKAG